MRISESFANLPALEHRKRIPPAKRKLQVVHTLVGGLVFLAGLAAPTYLGFPWQAGLGLAAFGAFTASKQLVLDFLKAAPQAVAAIVGALAGKKPD